jgi:23S rRNA A2030 N6-methylase RlmJ
MAHTHSANEGDYLKHVVLEELLKQLCQLSGVQHVHYVDPYAGEGLFARGKAHHIPTSPAAKVQVWQEQQSNPDYYLGSPLIALQVLHRCGLAYSLRLSDLDGHAAEVLNRTLKGEVPKYKPPPIPNDLVVQVARYDGRELDSSLIQQQSAINVVLLDPTQQDGYPSTIDLSIAACRSSKLNVVLMCWGLRKWKWSESESLLSEPAREQAEYLQGSYPSIVHLLWFGALGEQLATVVRASVYGW